LLLSAAAPAGAATIQLRSWLDGAQVPLAVGGTGLGTVSFDTVTKVLSWSVAYGGLTGDCTLAHFHGPAPAGVNNVPTVNMTCSASPLTGSSAPLDATQEAQLLSGQFYINIHTGFYPNGEIRGQVVMVRGDMSGDGQSDVLWRNSSTGENYLYPMSGTTILGGEGYLRTVADQNWQVEGTGDFDGDGANDILWRNSSTGENYIYFMNGTSIAAEGYLRTVADQNWQVAGVGDVNGDGRADILWRNGSTGENYVYPMEGLSILGSEGYLRTVADQNWQVAGIGDFNGDGNADILWRNGSSGENYVYPLSGTTILGSEGFIRTVADLNWQVVGVADFDGDGRADILWRNGTSGENYMYPMAGLAIRATEGYLRSVADQSWQVAALGDYNGDGRSDIFWRNSATGENYVYPMAGTTILGTEGYTRTVAQAEWTPVGQISPTMLALQGARLAMSQLAGTVNAQGASLGRSHVIGYYDIDALHDGLDRNADAAFLASDLRGLTITGVVLNRVLRYDAANQGIIVGGSLGLSDGSVSGTETFGDDDGGLGFKRQPDGSWKLWGNRRIAEVGLQVEMRTSDFGPGDFQEGPVQNVNLHVEAPENAISSVTVSGGGLFDNTPVVQSAGVSVEEVEAEPGDPVEEYFFDQFFGGANSALTQRTVFAFTVTPATGPAQVYEVLSNTPTDQPVTVTSPTGHELADANLGGSLNVQWTLPGYATAQVKLSGYVRTAVSPDPGFQCRVDEQSLGTSATSGTINLPATCNDGSILEAAINVSVDGVNGERSLFIYGFR
jgi:hypothetical protein